MEQFTQDAYCMDSYTYVRNLCSYKTLFNAMIEPNKYWANLLEGIKMMNQRTGGPDFTGDILQQYAFVQFYMRKVARLDLSGVVLLY